MRNDRGEFFFSYFNGLLIFSARLCDRPLSLQQNRNAIIAYR